MKVKKSFYKGRKAILFIRILKSRSQQLDLKSKTSEVKTSTTLVKVYPIYNICVGIKILFFKISVLEFSEQGQKCSFLYSELLKFMSHNESSLFILCLVNELPFYFHPSHNLTIVTKWKVVIMKTHDTKDNNTMTQ